ncbi:uncharacterized protein B4U79_11706 [Dinothrombium tinctorium]|uniref:Uncharacterized protein n=1 Tax=Dinothrombium tinctorium TaxID=1965070 RepID=A0A443RB10_9ACAR|nr:uncharacterized protein B4U79_07560 [Dinothrombium tinctorium]RWS12452.1 uncharacterized protein B4U79_11706 [Dinothrombium tinctorium]
MSFACQMRIKGILLLLLCILITSVFYCLIGDQKPPFGTLVSETHRQISQLVVPAVSDLSSSNNQQSSEELDEKLRELGFFSENANANWQNISLPMFVTAVKSGETQIVKGFIRSIQDFYPDASLLLYVLDLDDDEISLINRLCNISNSCSLRKFQFERYPSHVNDLNMYAFRPIILQEVLNQTGAAVWLDPNYYVLPSGSTKAKKVIEEAKKEGILSWTIQKPTAALTHPRMFEFFRTQSEKYYFHRMIEPSSIIIYNSRRIHSQLMLPWVRCALTQYCIAPIGAQRFGCRLNKKPMYRYSGCHHYDMSALNIVLGFMFNFSEKPYVADEEEKFFKPISSEELDEIIDNDYNDLFNKLRSDSTLNETNLQGKRRKLFSR